MITARFSIPTPQAHAFWFYEYTGTYFSPPSRAKLPELVHLPRLNSLTIMSLVVDSGHYPYPDVSFLISSIDAPSLSMVDLEYHDELYLVPRNSKVRTDFCLTLKQFLLRSRSIKSLALRSMPLYDVEVLDILANMPLLAHLELTHTRYDLETICIDDKPYDALGEGCEDNNMRIMKPHEAYRVITPNLLRGLTLDSDTVQSRRGGANPNLRTIELAFTCPYFLSVQSAVEEMIRSRIYQTPRRNLRSVYMSIVDDNETPLELELWNDFQEMAQDTAIRVEVNPWYTFRLG
ncbi:hypothetical protein PQX77_007176 [Marasmius sp. AFHP31]|nr:hypothetical protein PQX77_007176 [Marasmius sp. AFHP31]